MRLRSGRMIMVEKKKVTFKENIPPVSKEEDKENIPPVSKEEDNENIPPVSKEEDKENIPPVSKERVCKYASRPENRYFEDRVEEYKKFIKDNNRPPYYKSQDRAERLLALWCLQVSGDYNLCIKCQKLPLWKIHR
jgi:hypothetical protein